MREITKRFDALVANDRVDFDLRDGEVHALLGENGAGKSTLMNILSGVLTQDSGAIELAGVPTALSSPKAALDAGIAMVHQHFRLIEAFSVAENLHVGWSGAPAVFKSSGKLEQLSLELFARFDLSLSSRAKVEHLSVGEKQRVEILKTLARGAEVLILDEPTASLAPTETQALFRLLDEIRGDGRTVVFISHKLPEVLAISDRITVMRQGRKVATIDREQADAQVLAELMVGGAVARAPRRAGQTSESGFVVTNVSARDDLGLPALRDVDLVVRGGEIVGVAGVTGNGQRELSEVLAGVRKLTGGRIVLDNQDLSKATPREFLRAGVGYVPEDRLGTGLAGGESIWRNAILKTYHTPPIAYRRYLRRTVARDATRELVTRVHLSATDPGSRAGQLSGGHAQRLLTGREMAVGTRALVLAYPTRGLDLRAVELLHTSILEARQKGVAVLFISEDLDEITDLADRVVVLYEGRVVGEFTADGVDRETLGALMSGLSVHTPESASRPPT